MWQVKADNLDVKFTFRHLRGLNYFDGKSGHTITDATMCDLVVNERPFWALSLCSASDNYVKETGRKIALERAIEKARREVDLPKPVRQKIWNRYFNRTVKPEMWQFWADRNFKIKDDPSNGEDQVL